jgi:hypothetical protein
MESSETYATYGSNFDINFGTRSRLLLFYESIIYIVIFVYRRLARFRIYVYSDMFR